MQNLAIILTIIALLLPFVALIGLIKPMWLKQKDRKQVMLRFLLPVPILLIFAGIFIPSPAELKAQQETKEVAELKVKQEQEAKEAAELKAKQEQEEKEVAEEKAKAEQEAKKIAEEKAKKEEKWYVGGTLHRENALAWQDATDENKLATCGDIVSTMWAEKVLKNKIMNKINSIDDLKPLAKILVQNLDEAFKKDSDEKKNKVMFTNQKVSDIAILLAMQMGWLKLPKS